MGPYKSPSLVTKFMVTDDTLLIDLGQRRSILSSAPRGGGLTRARYIVNHQVPPNPIVSPHARSEFRWEDPSRYLGRVAARVGADSSCVALMTAVSLKHLVVFREEAMDFWVEGFITVGVSNAVRAGEPIDPPTIEPDPLGPGTINIILVTNARLSASAMVTVVQVATESKTAALLSHHIRSWTGLPGATGTGTDATVVASGDGPCLRYGGTHTKLGEMVGRLVRYGITEGLRRSKEWRRRQPITLRSPR